MSDDVKVWIVEELESQFAPGTYAICTLAASAFVHVLSSSAFIQSVQGVLASFEAYDSGTAQASVFVQATWDGLL